MRILLTNSPLQYYMTTAFFHPDWMALNLPQLAAMVPEHEVKILDNWHYWVRQEGVIKLIKQFRPDVLAISNSTAADTNRVLQMVRQIKKEDANIFIIMGGQAASVRYADSLNAGCNLVVMGEGEYTFQKIINRLKQRCHDFSDIDGIAHKNSGEFKLTPPRKMIKNLDDLPMPAWELMPKIKSNFFPGLYASVIESSRGCPYTCEFCSIQSYWKRSYRKKSNERIVAELKHLKQELGIEQVYFIDDSFALNVKEYTNLFETMIREGLTVKGFSQIRPDTIANNPEMIKLAAKAGFWGFLVGFDSYNEEELKNVSKTGGIDINVKAAKILRENGIGIFGVHMFGIPGSTLKSFAKTFELGMQNSDTFRMSRFSLIPGTPIYDKYLQEEQVAQRDGYVPYSHKIKINPQEERKMNRLYVWYEAKSLLSLRAIWKFVTAQGIARTLQWRAYLVAIRYAVYLLLRKIKITVL